MSSSIVYEKSSDFSQKVSINPVYKHTKLVQTQGGTSVSISAGTTATTYFDIPSDVVNFSKSYIDFNINVSQSGNAALFNACMLDLGVFRRLYLASRNGQYLCDLNNVQPYWKMCKNTIIKTEDFNSLPTASYASTLAAAQDNGLTLFQNPSNALTSTVPVAFLPHGVKIANDLTVNTGLPFRRNYQSEMPYVTGGAGNAAGTGALYLNCRVEFSRFAYTLFSVDRDFFSNEPLQLVIEWENYDSFLFLHSAVGTLADPASVSTGAGVPTITNVGLYLAVQQNPSISQGIRDKVRSTGLEMTIPFCTIVNNVLGDATTNATTVRIYPGMGKRILRIISAEALTASTLSGRYNFYNLGAVGIQNFYTQLDSNRIEYENIDETQSLGFQYTFEKLKGSPLGNLQEYYSNCPIYVNDWSSCQRLTESPEKDLTICGLDNTNPAGRVWAKYYIAKSAADYTTWVVIVTQKDLISTAQGIIVQ